MTTASLTDDGNPERRYDDEHTRHIVKMTIQEIFEGVGVDFETREGRQTFRDNITFLNDARLGTGAAKKGLLGIVLTGAAYGVWKVFIAIVPVLAK